MSEQTGVDIFSSLVLVEWFNNEHVDETSEPTRHVSVGYLVVDDEKVKVLAQSIWNIENRNNLKFSGEITIPTANILQINLLVQIVHHTGSFCK